MRERGAFSYRILTIGLIAFSLTLQAVPILAAQSSKGQLIHVIVFAHLEASPIRGIANTIQFTPWSGEGPAPYSVYCKQIVELCEKYHIKAELAMTPLMAHQLKEDFPDVVEKIKQMKFPITRYPSIAGHHLPPPVGELRNIPGMELSQFRATELSQEEATAAEWLAETHTLIPPFHFEGQKLIMENPLAGQPISLDQLADYRLPRDPEWLMGGTLALQKIFGVTPMQTFQPSFEDQPGSFRSSPVQKALGMDSYVPSVYKGKFRRAPISATAAEAVQWLAEHWPRDKAMYTDLCFTSPTDYDYNGAKLPVDSKTYSERLVQYMQARPNDFKIVWPDPEGVQWRKENSPLEFYRRTYGVSSLEGVLEMPCPVNKILSENPKPHYLQVEKRSKGEGMSWEERYLVPISKLGITSSGRDLPDFLRPLEDAIPCKQITEAARYLVANTRLPGSAAEFGMLPSRVGVGEENWSLAKAFAVFAYALREFAYNNVLPPSVSVPEVLGPVTFPCSALKAGEDLEKAMDRGANFPSDPYFNPVNLHHAAWEVAENLEKDLAVPGTITCRVSQEQHGNYSGVKTKLNAAEFLYAMAQDIVRLDDKGYPWFVPVKRLKMLSDDMTRSPEFAPTAWFLNAAWTNTSLANHARTLTDKMLAEAADYALTTWTRRHTGHTEDIGGPPPSWPLKGGEFSSNEVFQAFAFALEEYASAKKLPEKVAVKQVLGPVDYPMYDLDGEPYYNVHKLRGGWFPLEMSKTRFADPEIAARQGLPGQGHGGYTGYDSGENILKALPGVTKALRETDTVPAVIPITLTEGRRGPGPRGPQDAYCNPSEYLWMMAQLYRFITTGSSMDKVLLNSARIIQDQLHYYVVDEDPLGYTHAVYEYRQDSFDWIERIPLWRIHRSWNHE